MTDYTYPGVYIEEVPGGPGPIAGVSTSNLGLIGSAPKGKVDEAGLFTSFPELTKAHGTFNADGIAMHEAYAFFANGGQRLYFVRVAHDDAVEAYWDLINALTSAETLSSTAQGTGMYNLQLANVPATESTVVVTFGNVAVAANVNVFADDGAGNMVFDAGVSGGSAGGGSGSIDYDTGEISINLITPGDYTGGSDLISSLYSYRVFRFQMKWPGVSGNFWRVRITQGSDDFLTASTASWSRFSIFYEEDVNEDATDRAWQTIEQYIDVVLDDVNDPNYLTTVINDDATGSDNVEVIDYGNEMNPPALQGVAVSAEDFSATQEYSDGTSTAPTPYNAKWKGWSYDLANDCFETTFLAKFLFQEGGPRLGIAATAIATAPCIGVDKFDTTLLPITPSSVRIAVTLTTLGAGNIIDDGAGALIEETTSTEVGTIDYATGEIADTSAVADQLDVSGVGLVDTFVALSEIRWVSGTKIGTGTGATTLPVNSLGSVADPAEITPGTVRIDCATAAEAYEIITDTGAQATGNLVDSAAVAVGTINYATGAISNDDDTVDGVLELGSPAVAGSDVLISCSYEQPVTVEDDGDGNLSIADPATLATPVVGAPSKFQLNASGTNSIVYATGVFTLTWTIDGDLSAGPASMVSQLVSYYTVPDQSILGVMTSGADGSAVDSGDVVDPSLVPDQKGLYAFGQVDEMMQLVAADFQTDTYTGDALITYAELMKDKFVLLTVPEGLEPLEAVNWKKYQLARYTSYAALYYPHIKIKDPVTDASTNLPCGGHVAGIIARTDATANVSTAAAGVERGAIGWSIGLERDLTPSQVGVCNTNKINCLVQWPHTGRCVWGARTLDIAGGEWTYSQERRLFMYVEKSVFNATHIHVFKNNGPGLWAKIQAQVSNFLLGLYQQGYFAGTSPADSFFVICDRTNNPQNTVDQGIVFCDVGMAPTTPAEFIVFRFEQKALS